MVHRRTFLTGGLMAGAALAAPAGRLWAQANSLPEPEQQQALAPLRSSPFRLREAARFDHQATGVAVSPDGRVFVSFPRWTEDGPMAVAEVVRDGTLKPYPDERWNAWRNDSRIAYAARDHLVCVQSVVADSRGNLWVLDAAAPGMGKVLAGAAKLLRIELASGKVAQAIRFGEEVASPGAYLNDVQISPDGTTAYITDSGVRGALIVVDLERGKSVRRLDGHPSTQPEKGIEIAVSGRKVQRPDGRTLQAGADGLALSQGGRTLFWQALNGRTLYGLDTDELESGDSAATEAKVVRVGTTCVADGLLMSRDGQLYLTSPEDSSIKVWTGEAAEAVVADPLLAWPDSMAESSDGTIYVTASRLHETAWFHDGAPTVVPTSLFRLQRT